MLVLVLVLVLELLLLLVELQPVVAPLVASKRARG